MKTMEHKHEKYSKEIPNEMYGILHAEIRTGIVTDDQGKRVLGESIEYLLFPRLNSARNYSRQVVVSAPELECWIYDSQKSVIEVQKNKDYIEKMMEKEVVKKRPWWQIWK